MQDETKKLTEDEMKAICEKTRGELMQYAAYVGASLTTLETFLPKEMHVTIIVRKDDDRPGMDLAGAMIRTNDDAEKLVKIMTPLARAVHQNPNEFR